MPPSENQNPENQNPAIPPTESAFPETGTAPITQPTQPTPNVGFEPGVLAMPAAQQSAPQSGSSKTKKIIFAVIVIIVVAAIGAGAYAYQKTSSTKKKFNNLALSIKNQELAGAKNYVAAQAVLNDFGNSLNMDGSSASTDKLKQKMDGEISDLQKIVDQACANKSGDVTAAKIDSQMKGLKLNDSQKQYVSDMKTMLGDLAGTDYSNSGVCSDGPAIISLAKNFNTLLPGFAMLENIGDAPTAGDVATLKPYATMTLENQSDLEKTLPKTAQFLTDLKDMLGDLYYEFTALRANDNHTAAGYAAKIQDLALAFQKDSDGLTTEIDSFDKKSNDAATAASKVEISAIDYQLSHNSSNSSMQLDYALPAFRIADASVYNYYDQHNAYPKASSISDAAGLDDNLKFLKSKDLLKNLTYSSLGDDQSGFSLSAKLANGTTLSERQDPAGSQNI